MMSLKTNIVTLFFFLSLCSFAQNNDTWLNNISNQIEILSVSENGFNEKLSTEIVLSNISLSNFLLAVSELHQININVSPELNNIIINNNFADVTVADLLVFLCKEHSLDISFTGNILSVKKFVPEQIKRVPLVNYDPISNTISIDAKKDPLHEVFRIIIEKSGKNLVFTPNMDGIPLSIFFNDIPFDIAMDKLALGNNLTQTKTKDNFYVFEQTNATESKESVKPIRQRYGSLTYEVLDIDNHLLKVDFVNEPIANIIYELSEALNINIFTATPLDKAGKVSFKAKAITFDELLTNIFESQVVNQPISPTNNGNNSRNRNNTNPSNSNVSFSFKKEGDIYFFGTTAQLSVRKVEVIFLKHRSVQLLKGDNALNAMNNTSDRIVSNHDLNNDSFSSSSNGYPNTGGNQRNNANQISNDEPELPSLIDLLPNELIIGLDIKVDKELNSFYVNGTASKVQKFKDFIDQIDKPVPVILIEVMILEVSTNATIEAGVSFGLGTEPTETSGGIYPETNLSLGATSVNKILGKFNSFGGFNLGKVSPNFFASIKAMEANGDIKIKSTPKIAAVNGHRATFSNGQTSFYAVTRRNIYGTNNPQTSEYVNYYPIDAELALSVRPSVSGDGQVLLDISVIQSSFGGRIAEDAPPDVNSRSFSSLIRMKDQDVAILGGLEEDYKNNSGKGVPLLSKVPLLKWLVSKRKREARKSKLTVLIRPTVINN
jgi:type IV pilus assembly protein PilQ